MANNTIYTVDLNFKNALKAADEFASKLDSSISDALKQNRGFTGLIQGFKRISEIQEKFDTKHKRYQELENLRQKKNSGELLKSIHDIAKQQEELNKKKSESVGISAEETAELEKQEKTLKRQLEAAEKNLSVAESSVAEHEALAKELAKEAKSLEVMAERIAQSAESAKELKASLKGLIDPSKLGENLESAAERAADVFKDGIDVQALSRDLGKGLSKGINVAFKAMSGGSGAIMAVGGAIAGTVAALGVLLAAFIAVDKKVKEFNKDIVKTHGALSLMRMGGGDLNKGLQVVKRTVMDLSGTLGLSEQEATELLDTLDKGGLTLSRLTQGARNATQQQEMLTRSLRDINAIAGASGVSLSEYTDNLTNYVNDLAMSTQTVNDSFASIASMASESAFGTRRFYSMVVQATAGQASLNTRLEDTGDLLLRMSKILGAKKATEMVAGAKLSDKSTQDLTKMVIQSRGGMRRVIEQEARTTAGNLARQAYGGGRGAAAGGENSAVAQALKAAHLGTEIARAMEQAGSSGDSSQLINLIKDMNPQAQADAITAMTSSSDLGVQQTGQQLQQLVRNVRGMTGGIGAQTEAMANFGPRGSIMAVLAATRGTIGDLMNQDGDISEDNLIALENVSGYSREQVQSMRAVLSANRATWRTMTAIQTQGRAQTAEEEIASARANGAIVRNGHIIQASVDSMGKLITGAELHNAQEMFSNQNTALAADGEAARTINDIAQDTMDATVSVADILENKIARVMQSLYETVEGPLLDALSWIMDKMGIENKGGSLREQRKTSRAIDERIQEIQDAKRRTASNIARQQRIIGTSTATPEQKVAARQEIQRLQQEAAGRRDDVRIQALTAARGRVRSGTNTWDTRGHAYQVKGYTFATKEEALAKEAELNRLGTLGSVGEAGHAIHEVQMSTQQIVDRVVARALAPGTSGASPAATVGQGVRAPGAAPALPVGHGVLAPGAAPALYEAPSVGSGVLAAGARPAGSPAPAPAPGAAPGAAPSTVPAPAPAPVPTPQHANAANEPTVRATETAAAEQGARDRRSLEAQKKMQEELARLAQGKNLGDGLAASKLPDAIADADAKMRLTEALFKSGKNAAQVTQMLTGNVTAEDGRNPEYGGILQARQLRGAHDFVYQDNGGRSVITPIDREDQIMGMKSGGPIANAMGGGRGTGGNVNISINGGDERRVFEVVRRAIQQAGITPNRVPSGAT